MRFVFLIKKKLLGNKTSIKRMFPWLPFFVFPEKLPLCRRKNRSFGKSKIVKPPTIIIKTHSPNYALHIEYNLPQKLKNENNSDEIIIKEISNKSLQIGTPIGKFIPKFECSNSLDNSDEGLNNEEKESELILPQLNTPSITLEKDYKPEAVKEDYRSESINEKAKEYNIKQKINFQVAQEEELNDNCKLNKGKFISSFERSISLDNENELKSIDYNVKKKIESESIKIETELESLQFNMSENDKVLSNKTQNEISSSKTNESYIEHTIPEDPIINKSPITARTTQEESLNLTIRKVKGRIKAFETSTAMLELFGGNDFEKTEKIKEVEGTVGCFFLIFIIFRRRIMNY